VPLTDEQLALRRGGIGSSDAPAILGLSSFKTPFDVYLDKVEGFSPAQSFNAELGDLLEPVVLELYRRQSGATKLERPGQTVKHLQRPLILSSPDAIAYFQETEHRIVEAKALRYRSEEWGDEGSDGIDEAYLIQSQVHMAVARSVVGDLIAQVDVPVLFGASEFRVYRVPWDEELANLVIEECEKFWRDHVEAKRPPSMDGSRGAPAWLKKKFPRDTKPLIEATPEDFDLALELCGAKRNLVAAKGAYRDHENRWKQRIGEATGVKTSIGSITWEG
jgi:putative phage-type endonuclease